MLDIDYAEIDMDIESSDVKQSALAVAAENTDGDIRCGKMKEICHTVLRI